MDITLIIFEIKATSFVAVFNISNGFYVVIINTLLSKEVKHLSSGSSKCDDRYEEILSLAP